MRKYYMTRSHNIYMTWHKINIVFKGQHKQSLTQGAISTHTSHTEEEEEDKKLGRLFGGGGGGGGNEISREKCTTSPPARQTFFSEISNQSH